MEHIDSIQTNNLKKYPLVMQKKKNDCGIACLEMICQYYAVKPDKIAFENIRFHKNGISIEAMVNALKIIGFQSIAVSLEKYSLLNDIALPAIACIKLLSEKLYHYIVIYEIVDSIIIYADPANGIKKKDLEQFYDSFTGELIII